MRWKRAEVSFHHERILRASSFPVGRIVCKENRHFAEPLTGGHRKLWEDVANATDDVSAVRALANIVVEKQGRAFALTLNHKEAELCVETLDYVSRDLRLHTPFRRLR